MAFEIGKKYKIIDITFVSLLLDPNNKNNPHPLLLTDPKNAFLLQNDTFEIIEIINTIENDSWPIVLENKETIEFKKTVSYLVKVYVDKINNYAIIFLSQLMLDKQNIIEIQ
jgi:hypothetical protein